MSHRILKLASVALAGSILVACAELGPKAPVYAWGGYEDHIYNMYASPGEAMRIAKVYLLKWHGEGQLPYAQLVRNKPHADAQVREAEDWLEEHFKTAEPVSKLIESVDVAERTLKRRFKAATGQTIIERVQNLRVEEAKRQLETTRSAIDDISADVGYEDAAFFRRLFKRRCGVTPSDYRRMFAMPGEVIANNA